MKSKCLFLLAVVSLLSLWTNLFAQQSEEEKATIVKVGQSVPDFVFTDEHGVEVSISDFKGKVLMISFFATWCGPCREELPHIESGVYNKYKSNPDFKLLVIGREHTTEELTKFKEKNGFDFSMVPDPKREIYSKFAVQFIPRNFVIDRGGNIIYSSVGFNKTEFDKLKELLAKELGAENL